jgi:heptosyltransferase I
MAMLRLMKNIMKSILIIRPSAIGDIIMASPVIRVLRESYPDARIAWLIEPPVRDLLQHNKNLDEVIIWPKSQWRELFVKRHFILLKREISKFTEQLRSRNFDLTLDVQGLLRSRWLAWLSGAEERIGFKSKEPGEFLMTKIYSRGLHTGMMGSEYFYIMQELGLFPGEFHPEITLSPEDEDAGRKMIKALNIHGGYAVFAPFTTRPQKHWFEDRWADLAAMVLRCFDLPVVLLGGKGDKEGAGKIKAAASGSLFDLTGQTTLGQGAAIIKNSSLVVGVDTGLTHMGAAFDRPTAALFGATCPYLYTASKKTHVIYNPMSCSPCRRSPVCKGDFTCMKSITAEQVMEEAIRLMEVS